MNKTYEFSQGIIRVVRVLLRDGHPSGKCARVGTDTVRLILEGEGMRNPLISMDDIERAAFFLAKQAKVRNDLLSVQEEMKALMSRPDFQYGKDYTELYTQNIPF